MRPAAVSCGRYPTLLGMSRATLLDNLSSVWMVPKDAVAREAAMFRFIWYSGYYTEEKRAERGIWLGQEWVL